ncbi:sugar kinase [Latilactobacillus sakei]|uniref:sugar kinase n=1 Tax=Latilactobacillus sakei TaxID=1599 RepID=UPI0038886EAE
MSEVITIGEPLVCFASKDIDQSLAAATNFQKILGGAELNVAIGVKRLGHTVDYITQVGSDPFGDFVKATIAEHGVGTRYISEDADYWTGHQIKQLVSKGDPATFNYRKGSAAAHLNSEVINNIDLTDVKIAHMSGIFPAISATAEQTFRNLLEKLVREDKFITFDPNLRPSLWDNEEVMRTTINELAAYADVVLPGVEEGKILMGSDDPEEIADFYLKGARTKTVIVKVGAEGAFIKNKDGSTNLIKGFKVDKVVDTVGAGDGFALGVITAILDGKSIESAVLRGNAVGALQVQTPRDNDGYPTVEQLSAFYQMKGAQEK